jgi:hypothetical protein
VTSFEEDFEWQQKFRAHFSEIAHEAMRVDVAPAEEDWKRNTDFIMSTVILLPKRDIRISARVRRHKYIARYRDQFTVRLDRPSGVDAEMPKIRAGWGDFTIYGFESETGSDRMGPWFIGNVNLLRSYLREPGHYYSVHGNDDGSSRLAAFHIADMPLGFLLKSDGLTPWGDGRIWEHCRKCWWGKGRGGYVAPTAETPAQPHRIPERLDAPKLDTGYGRFCLACRFWWRSGWVMKLTDDDERE